MKVLVVAEESTESVDFLIINLIDGDYDTTGFNADRVENILAFRKWCAKGCEGGRHPDAVYRPYVQPRQQLRCLEADDPRCHEPGG